MIAERLRQPVTLPRVIDLIRFWRFFGPERIEPRLSVRLVALSIGWWTAITLAWVGSPWWVWIGGGSLLTAGHAFSWHFRNSKSMVRAIIIGAGVMASLPLVPRTLESGSNGDWLPAAHFMILFQGVAAFELRTRMGLYASIALSGVVLFFATQRALDVTFGLFLGIYTVLVLVFLALSYVTDQIELTRPRWFDRRISQGWFWGGVAIVLALTATLVFFILPKDMLESDSNFQGAILPLRNNEEITGESLNPELNMLGSALPQNVRDIAEETTQPEPGENGDSESQMTPGEAAQSFAGGFGDGAGDALPVPQPLPPLLQEGAASAGSGSGGGGGSGPGGRAPDDVVMQVRSPVLTYWRGQIFDEFDGELWYTDRAFRSARRLGDDRLLLRARHPGGLVGGPLYPHNVFLFDAPSDGVIFTGYAPLTVTLPLSPEGNLVLDDGSIYRVISTFSDFSREVLEQAPSTSHLGPEYHDLHESVEPIRDLALDLTDTDFTDLDRAQRIIAFMDHNYLYDARQNNQLAMTAHPLEFLEARGSGTSMDFASATVLLARGAGIPARLVTGFLPGNFDPLSGTYVVRDKDAHAWAELYFANVGWVPFDSVPRPETAAFGAGGTRQPPITNSLFGLSFGSEAFDAARSTPNVLSDVLGTGFGSVVGIVMTIVGGVFVVGFVLLIWRLLKARRSRVVLNVSYSTIDGDGRAEVVDLYQSVLRRLERKLNRETLVNVDDFWWLQRAAWAAAYNPAPFDSSVVPEARNRAERLSRAF